MLIGQYINVLSTLFLSMHLVLAQSLDREERRHERRRQRLQGIAGEDDYAAGAGDTLTMGDRRRNKVERRQDKLERREERREERRRQRIDNRLIHGTDVTLLDSDTGGHKVQPALPSVVSHSANTNGAPRRTTLGKPSRHRGKVGIHGQSRQALNGESINEEKIYRKQKEPPGPVDLEWLAANVSSLWHAFRNLQHHLTYRNQRVRGPNGRRGRPESNGEECPGGEGACRGEENGIICSSHGVCDCGNCDCNPGYYGTYCQCSDHTCPAYNGMACGGPSRGQCRCGDCVCRPGYVGDACDCSTDTSSCHKDGEDILCSNQGTCECGTCKCNDGYQGLYCSDNVYAAGVCERLKPCVLCKAWKKEIPQCVECHVTLTMVDSLEPGMKTCVMVSKGCLMQYSYNAEPDGEYSVQVPRNMTCSTV